VLSRPAAVAGRKLGFGALAALVVLAVALAWVLLRRDGHTRPLVGALGVTGLLALGVVATELWNPYGAVYGTAAGVTVTCAAFIGCVLAARLSLPRGTSQPWPTAGLAALAGCAVLAAGEHVRTVLLLAASGRPQSGSPGYLAWAFALSAAAVVLLALLDRRDPWGRDVTGPGPAAAPAPASAPAPEPAEQ
jgi:hypothetical protein